MNHVFRQIWSALRAQWVCVAETATAHAQAKRPSAKTSAPCHPTVTRFLSHLTHTVLFTALMLTFGLMSTPPLQAETTYYRENQWESHDFDDPGNPGYSLITMPQTVGRASLFLNSEYPWISVYPQVLPQTATYVLNGWASASDITTAGVFARSSYFNSYGTNPVFQRISSVGGTSDYAVVESAVILKDGLLEGRVLNSSVHVIGTPWNGDASTPALYGQIQGGNLYLQQSFGDVFYDANATEPRSQPQVSLHGLYGLRLLGVAPLGDTLRPNSVLDLDALAHIAGDGRTVSEVQALYQRAMELTILNPISYGSIQRLEEHRDYSAPSDPYSSLGNQVKQANFLPTLNLQSLTEQVPTTSYRSFEVQSTNLIKMDGGETIDFRINTGGPHLTVWYKKNNAVVLGTPSHHTIVALEEPMRLFDSQQPLWTPDGIRGTKLAVLSDITFTAAQLNQIASLTVVDGTTRFSGDLEPDKVINVVLNGTLEITGDSTVLLYANSGLVKFMSGTIALQADAQNARFYIPNQSVRVTAGQYGTTSVYGEHNRLITPVTDLDALNAYIRALQPQTLETLRPMTELPSGLFQGYNPHWKASANAQVSRYPNIVTVAPQVKVVLEGNPDNLGSLQLINEGGRLTLKNAQTSIRYWGTDPAANFHLDNTRFAYAQFTLDHLGQLTFEGTTFAQRERDWDQGIILNTHTLGAQPSWWTPQWWNNQARLDTLTIDTVTDEDFSWFVATGNFADHVNITEATLSAWPRARSALDRPITFDRLALTSGESILTVPSTVNERLTLGDRVQLTLSEPLTLRNGARIELGRGATIVLSTPEQLQLPAMGFDPVIHNLTVSVAGEGLSQGRDPAPFIEESQKALTQIETRDALRNVPIAPLAPYGAWVMRGDVTGIVSRNGNLPLPVEVARSATFTAPQLTVHRLLDIFGTVVTDRLTLGNPEVEESQRTGAMVNVHAGATLDLHEAFGVVRTPSSSLNVLDGGTIKANAQVLMDTTDPQRPQPLVNRLLEGGADRSLQRGTWIPSYASDLRYDLTGQLVPLTRQFAHIAIPSEATVIVTGEQSANYHVAPRATLEVAGETHFRRELAVEGTLKLHAPITFEHENASTPWLTKLVLHDDSQLVMDQEGALHWRGASLETDARILSTTQAGRPAWWNMVQAAVAQSTTPATLITTGTAQTVDPHAFGRWEVRGLEAHANAIAEDTIIYAGKTLYLKNAQLNQGLIKNFGTLVLTDSFINSAPSNRIDGGGKVEIRGSGTTTFQGESLYAGHTTLKSGTLRLKKYAGLLGNLTLEAGTRLELDAPLYAPLDERTASTNVHQSVETRGFTQTANSLTMKRGSILQVDLQSLDSYTRLGLETRLQLESGARLSVKVSPEVARMPLGTKFEGVLLYWEGREGHFEGVRVKNAVPDIAFEVEESDAYDLQMVYEEEHHESDSPEWNAMSLVLVANNERLPDPPPETENPPVTPAPSEPTDPTNPSAEPDEPTTPETNTGTQPNRPLRTGEQPLLSGTGKVALAGLTRQLNDTRLSAPRTLTPEGEAVWVSLIGGTGRLAGQSSSLGMTSEHTGVTFGAEHAQGQSRVGLEALAASSRLDAKDSNGAGSITHELSATTWLVGLYAEHDLTDRVTLDVNVAAGRSRLKGERQFTGEGLTAKSRTHASLYHAGVGLTWKATEVLKPFARLDYSRVTVKGFKESGANEHNQHVSRDAYNELVARVGAVLSTSVTDRFAWSARVSAGVDLLDGLHTTRAQFVDGSGQMAVKNTTRSRVVGDVALGLAYQASPHWTLSATLSGEARRHQREGAIDLRSTWTF